VKLIADRYAVLGKPLTGGMSLVYKAVDTARDGAAVAIKVYEAKPIDDALLHESFRRERSALRELKHDHIVPIVDEGMIEDTGQYFVCVHWLESTLDHVIRDGSSKDWYSFYRDIGRPILDAISFAHNRGYVHRDIKPQNIMFSAEGVPKLVDFGTSKLKRYIHQGVTLRDFVSVPFSPPGSTSEDDGFSKDTYGFCVTAIDFLSGGKATSHEVLHVLISELSCSPAIKEILTRGISEYQEERFVNGDALLSQFEIVEQKRLKLGKLTPECYVKITNRCLERACSDFGVNALDVASDLIIEDLNADAAYSGYGLANKEGVGGTRECVDQFQILGAEAAYHAKVDERSGDHIVILNMKKKPPYHLERDKERACPSPVTFRIGTVLNSQKGQNAIDIMRIALSAYEVEQDEKAVSEGWRHLFKKWTRILDAKSEFEYQKQDPLRFRGRDLDGSRIEIKLEDEAPSDLIGQKRVIRLKDGSHLAGEVEDVSGDELTFVASAEYVDPENLPFEGTLIADASSNQASLNRQRDAVEAVMNKSEGCVRSDLVDFISHPAKIADKSLTQDIQFFQKLDEDKANAVSASLCNDDFILIEGPPGTGKTTLIAEIVLQELKRNPSARILLTSQTHVALDNAIERISSASVKLQRPLSIIRIGRPGDVRISADVQPLLLRNKLKAWKTEAIQESDRYLDHWGMQNGLSKRDVEVGLLVEGLLKFRLQLDWLTQQEKDHQAALGTQSENIACSVADESNAVNSGDPIDSSNSSAEDGVRQSLVRLRDQIRQVSAELHSWKDELSRYGDLEKELSEQDGKCLHEFLSVYLTETPVSSVFRKMIELAADWRLRFGMGHEFQTALLSQANVVASTCIAIAGYKNTSDVAFDLCILDEASKATATEALVPLSRSKRWVLVGDLKQLPPFQDEALRSSEIREKFNISPDDLGETLFSHLLSSVSDGAKFPLRTQYRMVPEIGNLVSQCFYPGLLETATVDADKALAAFLGKPVVWRSTSRLANRSQIPRGESLTNPCECDLVRQELRSLNGFAEAHGQKYKVCILTPYGGQLNALRRMLEPEMHKWEELDLDINTVDAYQGREADIAILSLVRSDRGKRLGFLKEPERLNVALSRGKFGLIIIGDGDYLRAGEAPNPFVPVIGHIRNTSAECLWMEIN